MWSPTQPYNDLPDPPVAELEPPRVLKHAIDARAALAGLDHAARRLPNPMILISAVSLLEAQASSEVENIVTTTDDLFQLDAEVEANASVATKETLRYRTALFSGLASIKERPLTFRTAQEVRSQILDRQSDLRTLPGTYIGDSHTGTARYTPPVGVELLHRKLAAWEQFMHDDHGLDPLVTMAAAHYQFEAIHPFPDGNGRTGRILNVLILIDKEVLHEPVLYLSRHLIRNKNEYYDLLLRVTRDGDWESWITFMLDGVRDTSIETLRMIEKIETLQQEILEHLRALSSRGNVDLLNLLFEQPYTRIASVMDRCGVSRPTATKWLDELVDAELIDHARIGRERLFINRRFLNTLSLPPSID